MRLGSGYPRSLREGGEQQGGEQQGGEQQGGEQQGGEQQGGGAALEGSAGERWARWLSPGEARRALGTLAAASACLALLSLGVLAVRSAVRLNLRWDTFAYHLPFAALHGGLGIPYEMNDLMRPAFEAYPILPELLQGVLWRLTGSMNATGVVNYLAFALFLAYAHLALRAPFWVVGLVSLTAPLVVIHACSSYVDLFGNAFVAIGLSSCLAVYLAPERTSRATLLGAPLALAAAAWSKYLLAPIAGVGLLLWAALCLRAPRVAGLRRAQVATLCGLAALLAAAPYLKNLVVFGNPFWPLRVPLIGDWFPFTNDAVRAAVSERPAAMQGSSQLALFFRSLLELDQPTRYPDRLRWIIDQGGTTQGFRTGGFWGIAAVVYGLVLPCLLVVCHGKRGWAASAALLAGLCAAGLLPQSQELRYYLFIPLSGAAAVGLLYPRLARVAPRAALALSAVVLGLFAHMVLENLPHYAIERVGQAEAARSWGAAGWWPRLRPGQTYCAVGMMPIGMLLTGPTLSEYSIVDRSRVALCPPGSRVIADGVLADGVVAAR